MKSFFFLFKGSTSVYLSQSTIQPVKTVICLLYLRRELPNVLKDKPNDVIRVHSALARQLNISIYETCATKWVHGF